MSNEALCVITGLTAISIKIEETAQYYEYIKGYGNLIDREMEAKYWTRPANCVKLAEGQGDSKHTIHVYTDGCKGEHGVGSGTTIFTDSNIADMKNYRLKGRCSDNQAEQLAILKALENIQYMETDERTVIVATDSRITLESLINRKNHTNCIETIRMKVKEMEMQNWKIEFNWIKTHAGHQRKEMADQLAKEAATKGDIDECYKRIPRSTAISELSDLNVTKWQSEWDHTAKGAITKSFFHKIADRIKININITPNFKTTATGHCNVKLYLHKYKILDSPMCSCKSAEQAADHMLCDGKLLEQERDSLKAAVLRT